MMFKRIGTVLTAIVLAVIALPVAQAQGYVTGSGNVVTDSRPVSGVTSVELRGTGEVTITQGNTESLTVTSDDNILPLLTSEIVEGKLILSVKPESSIFRSSALRFDVTLLTIQSVELTGAGSITVNGVKADEVSARLQGAGGITLNGEVGKLTVELSGAGNVEASDLVMTTLDVRLSGVGNVYYQGAPQITTTRTGLGEVINGTMPPGVVPSQPEFPSVVIPEVIIPPVNIDPITIPAVEIPAIVIPGVNIPPVTIDPVTIPPVEIPAIFIPGVNIPPVTIDPVTIPPVEIPAIVIPGVSAFPANTGSTSQLIIPEMPAGGIPGLVFIQGN